METDQGRLLKVIASLFNKHKIPYMITGAWSVIYYGRPRASHDIDFVVEIYKEDVEHILKTLQTLSPDFSYEPHAIRTALKDRSMFQILHLPTYLKFDCWILKSNPFDQSRFRRRKNIRLLDQSMIIATAEDTILQKLRWYKEAKIEKHLVDAAFVYKIQENNLDKKYLTKWVRTLSVNKYLKEAKKVDLAQYI
ncbi:hypothetical protein HY029_01190 [Candidatus Gottesmanbacteria bacterium]|nr:hypothetical protein [Candidatus Gottesmanbacteria bacterium]